MSEILTNDEQLKILQICFKDPKIKFLSSDIVPLSENSNGFLGEHSILKIRYHTNSAISNELFFLKTFPVPGSVSAIMATSLKAFEKEIFFYDFLSKEYEKNGYNTSFAPKCYYCKDNSTLVMENLIHKGYKIFGRNNLYGFKQCKTALKTLAQFHGAGVLYEEEQSQKLQITFRLDEAYSDIFQEYFFNLKDKKGFLSVHFKAAKETMESLMQFLPETDQKHKEKFIIWLKKFDFDAIFSKKLFGHRKVCSHGDLWTNNIMFDKNYEKCVLVDYQMLRYLYPAFDVLSLLYFCTNRTLRKEHKNQLVRYYYEELSQYTDKKIEEIISSDDFLITMEHFEFLANFQAAAGHTLTYLPLEIEQNETLENLLIGNRPNIACRAFEISEIYRTVLTDDLYSLMDIAFKLM